MNVCMWIRLPGKRVVVCKRSEDQGLQVRTERPSCKAFIRFLVRWNLESLPLLTGETDSEMTFKSS